uniref:Uncharacterized protein n=1 Tax=Mucochytrium quahogii TaxID=96639 RepID=A0A7S2S793_9STRA|mmetsp:Transcript_1527/g.2319  ORF Transcript_1527/g.2319 Transcript_1527/m.2319 type:complete len:118 (+) Transcript_1527:249-602(+)
MTAPEPEQRAESVHSGLRICQHRAYDANAAQAAQLALAEYQASSVSSSTLNHRLESFRLNFVAVHAAKPHAMARISDFPAFPPFNDSVTMQGGRFRQRFRVHPVMITRSQSLCARSM